MRKLVRQWLAGLFIVVTALGGMAGALMYASSHSMAAPAAAAPNAFWTAHGHDGHHHDDHSHKTSDRADTPGLASTADTPLSPAADWCQHDHGACCTSTALIGAVALAEPVTGRGTRLRHAGTALLGGQHRYPPLRPPIVHA